MKIGVISDTHVEWDTYQLEELLEDQLSDAEVIVHAGDFTDPSIADFLSVAEGKTFYGVLGNADPIAVGLPRKVTFEAGGLKIGVIHDLGSPSDMPKRAEEFFGKVDVVVYGHTHKPFVKEEGGVLFVNPGSMMQPRGGSKKSVAMIEILGGKATAKIIELK